MFWRTIRGMLPHKTAKGKAALQHLKVFEGIPSPYDHKKRMVVPEALKVLRMKAHRKFCVYGDLCQMAGWTKKELINTLEEKRKVKSQKYFDNKKKKEAAKAKTVNDKGVKTVSQELAKFGF